MCVAIVLPARAVLPRDVFFACDRNNPDGAGFAFLNKDGIVEMCKSVNVDGEFYKMYQTIALESTGPMLLHFRIGTQGTVSDENCHPFKIKDGALIHNGVFWNEYQAKDSDTNQFCADLGDILSYDFVRSELKFLGDEIGKGNKVAMLYNGGRLAILNRDNWTTTDIPGCEGVLFSNTYFRSALSRGVFTTD